MKSIIVYNDISDFGNVQQKAIIEVYTDKILEQLRMSSTLTIVPSFLLTANWHVEELDECCRLVCGRTITPQAIMSVSQLNTISTTILDGPVANEVSHLVAPK